MVYLITTIISVIGNLVLGALVFSKDKKNFLNIQFLIFTLLLAAYIATSYISMPLQSTEIAKISFFLSPVLKGSAFAWIISLCIGPKPKITISIYIIGIILGGLNLISNLGIKDLIVTNTDFQYSPGLLSPIYFMYTLGIVLIGSYLLIKSAISVKGAIRRKFIIIITGLISYAVIAFVTGTFLPTIGIKNFVLFDIPGSLIFIGSTTYAMIKYKKTDN